MSLLIVNGEPFRVAFLRRLRLFSDLDFIQICILDIFLGGFIFYVLSMLPFRLFSLAVTAGFTAFCFFSCIYIHFRTLKALTRPNELRSSLLKNKKVSLDYAIVFAMFFFLLIMHLVSLSNFVLGGIFDESIHSLKVEVILENNYVPLTLQPYLPEGVIYPQASHVIFAFAYYMLNFTVPKAVFYVTILFKSLSVFGAYFLGKKLSSNRIYALTLSFVFTFVSSWPLYVSWGSNPFLVGFPLFLVDLGLFFPLVRSSTKNSFAELAAVGLLFGFAGALIVSYVQTLIVVAFFGLIYWAVKRRNFAYRKLAEFFTVLLFSLVPLIPVLYRFFAFYQYPGHNIGLPAEFAGYQTTRLSFAMTQALQWAFDNLSPHFLIRLLIIFFIASLALLLWKLRDYEDLKPIIAFALTVFVSSTLLSFVSFFLSTDLEVISWGHQGILIAVSLCILLVAFYAKIVKICNSFNLQRVSKFFSKSFYPNVLLATIVLASLNAPFVYYRLFMDPQVLGGAYRIFAVTTSDDYNLMTWMKANLSSDAVVLVSPYESGLFIPAISHHRIAFPYSGSAFTPSYQTLVNLTRKDVLNETTYDLMLNLSISHVFVGSDAAYWWFERQKWNPLLFLGNPNFKLVKNFGQAYLFQFDYAYPHVVFFDDFEHKRWDENGWRAYLNGNGVGNVTVTNSSAHGLGGCLKMTSQASYTVTELKHASYTQREIFVQNDSDVKLSFYLSANEGFHGKDTFAVIVSNVYRNQTVMVATPNGIFEHYSHTALLNASEGFFNFDLSTLWTQAYNSYPPSHLILELVNYDTDGIKNVAYLDNITITSTPIT